MCPLIPINCDFLKIIPIAKETEFELQSMKKDTAGTAELLDQFYRVEVGHQQDFLVEDKNDSISNFDRLTEQSFAGYVRFRQHGVHQHRGAYQISVLWGLRGDIVCFVPKILQCSGWTSWLPQSADQKKLFGSSKVILW